MERLVNLKNNSTFISHHLWNMGHCMNIVLKVEASCDQKEKPFIHGT
jgi:hypothetical protein